VARLFYIHNGVFLALFQRTEKRVLVVTLKVQTTVKATADKQRSDGRRKSGPYNLPPTLLGNPE
jgi:hypothetical protein